MNQLTKILSLILALAISQYTYAQVDFEVKRIEPHIAVTQADIKQATRLTDIHPNFETSWISKYLAVEISASCRGQLQKVVSKSDILSQAQKEMLNKADVGTTIGVQVTYMPQNTLSHNDPKEIDFEFIVEPAQNASFPEGTQALNQYLKEKAINKIPTSTFKQYELTAVKFTINEEGAITNAHLFKSGYQSFKNDEVETLLVETIRNMPCWEPAIYADGTKTKQEFTLTVGDKESCLMNLLHIPKK